MRIVFGGNNARGVACLRALLAAEHEIVAVLTPSTPSRRTSTAAADESVAGIARQRGVPLFEPTQVNEAATLEALRLLAPDLAVLAGFSPIVGQPFVDLPRLGCINLHGGKLPQYRGSSPMNWALINGEREFTLSIIRVDAGIDTGDVLAERTFPIEGDHTIADLQQFANKVFPDMLLEVVVAAGAGTLRPRKQAESEAAYYPLRFPEDGLLLFDTVTAAQAHDRIRALTDPYPGAFTFWNGRRLTLLQSRPYERPHHGEAGRVYRVSGRGLLVCASDRCLWIERAVASDTGEDAIPLIARYDKLATLRDLAVAHLVAPERSRPARPRARRPGRAIRERRA
jgi:methionyl-tRNA formyltransferase